MARKILSVDISNVSLFSSIHGYTYLMHWHDYHGHWVIVPNSSLDSLYSNCVSMSFVIWLCSTSWCDRMCVAVLLMLDLAILLTFTDGMWMGLAVCGICTYTLRGPACFWLFSWLLDFPWDICAPASLWSKDSEWHMEQIWAPPTPCSSSLADM